MSEYKSKKYYLAQRDKYLDKNKKWLVEKKKRFDEYKKTFKCVKCDEARYYVLDFHHIDPIKKEYGISSISKYSLERIKKEIEKCVVLCSNCHREFHHLEREQKITIKQYLNMPE
jgi:transcription elongation factor Elf1